MQNRVSRYAAVRCLFVIVALIGIGWVNHASAAPSPSKVGSPSIPASQQSYPPFRWPWRQEERVRWAGGPHAYGVSDPTVSIPTYSGNGLDFGKDGGGSFDVLAMASGIVLKDACGFAGLGCIVAIKHTTGGSVMIYAHLQPNADGSAPDNLIVQGQIVDMGTIIGKAGQSGGQPAIHLHIEWRDGTVCTQNPYCGDVGWAGNPIPWDGKVSFDGRIVAGYCVLDGGDCTDRIYNYDGSAVLGTIAQIYSNFPYFDGDTLQRTLASVHPTFTCPYTDRSCEIDQPNRETIFAAQGQGLIGGGGYRSTGPILPSSNSAIAPPPPPNPTPTPPPTVEPPPSSDGIQIVSVSSHQVSPGAQINPSVTIRVTSGQLLVSRGDHLHAIPEDTTNTFGAWPVQAVKSNVSTGGTYTFDVNNDSGFRMTAPNTPGSYVSRWQLRVGGNHIGPVVEIPITVQTATPPPTPSGWRAQYWNGYFSDNPWGNGRCKSDDYTDSIPFTKNWGSSGPGSGCSGDRFSVLYERRFSFSGGRYRFHCHRDGYCRFFIPELGISHAEEGGSFGGMDFGVDIPSGSWEVKIEYSHKRENGDSRLEFWWQGPESYLPPLDADCAARPYEWCAGYRVAWNSPTDSYILRRLEGSGYLDHDWGNSGPGYGIYADFSAEWSRLARFDAGLYRFHTTHDDGVKINVAGQEILNQWGTCCREDTADVWLPSGDHRITVNWFDSGGGANIRVWWEKITPCYTLNLTTTPSGAGSVGVNPTPNCPADGSKYTAGTNVTLTANPSAPNDFVGWGGDVSGSASSIIGGDKRG